MNARVARADERADVIDTITSAFQDDPVWGWAFPDAVARPAQFTKWWSLFVDPAIANGYAWVAPYCDAVSIWIPPGGEELRPEDEAREGLLLEELLGERAAVVSRMLRTFEAEHPTEPHYYLSFVATHFRARGKGLGVALLSEGLSRVDAEHMPAYLESSNPANHARYERLGFEPCGEFYAPKGGPPLLKMWRAAR